MNLENRRKMEELIARCAELRRRIVAVRLDHAHTALRERVEPKP